MISWYPSSAARTPSVPQVLATQSRQPNETTRGPQPLPVQSITVKFPVAAEEEIAGDEVGVDQRVGKVAEVPERLECLAQRVVEADLVVAYSGTRCEEQVGQGAALLSR